MSHYRVGCDADKRYSQFAFLDQGGSLLHQDQGDHEPGDIRTFLDNLPHDTPVTLESVGHGHWIVEEIEAAGGLPLLARAAKTKGMMGNVNKSDRLNAKALTRLLQLDSLPTVWPPPGDTREEWELHRTRKVSSRLLAGPKNRIHSAVVSTASQASGGPFPSRGVAAPNMHPLRCASGLPGTCWTCSCRTDGGWMFPGKPVPKLGIDISEPCTA